MAITLAELQSEQRARLEPKTKKPVVPGPVSASSTTKAPAPVYDTEITIKKKELLDRRSEVVSKYEALISAENRASAEMREKIRTVEMGLKTPQDYGYKNLSRMRKAARSNASNFAEQRDAQLERIDRDLRAADYAERKGVDYSKARMIIKKKDARTDVSTKDVLQSQAARGDVDAAAQLALKERLEARGRFESRVIPRYEGETSGKKSGVFRSPLTGKPVLVREGGANSLPPAARAKFTYDPYHTPKGIWSRDYVLIAEVNEPQEVKAAEKAVLTPAKATKYPKASSTVSVTISPEPQETGFQGSSQPEGTGTIINVPRYFAESPELVVSEITRPTIKQVWESPETAFTIGELEEQEAESKLKKLDLLGSASPAFQTIAYKFGGGTVKTVKSFVQQPAESLLTLSVYAGAGAAGGAIGGPPGAYTAVGAVFGAQNVIEFKQGETPTVIRAVKEPISFTGEMAPFILIEGARSARASAKARAATTATEGTIVTTETGAKIGGVPSPELRVVPLESVKRTVQVTESAGSARTLGVQQPVYGEETFMTMKEIEAQPAAFITDTNIRVIQRTKPASGSQKGLSAKAETLGVETSRRGSVSAQELNKVAQDRIIVAEAEKTSLSPYLKRETVIESDISFSGFEPPPNWELTTTKGKSPRPGPAVTKETVKQFGRVGIEKKGGMINYEPKLDYFEEFYIGTTEGKALIRESPYTGTKEIIIEKTPYVVVEVKSPARPPPAPKQTEIMPASGEEEIIIEVPQKDGTVVLQKIEFAKEPPKQETTTLTEQKQKQAQKTKQEQVLKQMIKADQTFKYIPKSQTGKPFSEAIVRFKGLRRVAVFPRLAAASSSAQASAVSAAQRVSTDQATVQKLATTQIQLSAVDVAQAVSSASVADTLSLSEQTTDFFKRQRANARYLEEERTPLFSTTKSRNDRLQKNLFGLSVRRKGVFQTVAKGLEFEEAVKRGAMIVGSTSAASFKVEGAQRAGPRGLNILGRQFRLSKRDSNVIVEKSRFRISTPGELSEITKKGQASRKKGKKKGLFGGASLWGF